ncbi:hypothetical protein F442_09291, partial [Phytophthora nicotianae P10297]
MINGWIHFLRPAALLARQSLTLELFRHHSSLICLLPKQPMRLPLLTILLSLALLSSVTDAAECTDSEAAFADMLWEGAAETSACKEYVVSTDPVSIDAPCSDTDCLAVVEAVAEGLPSCTFDGVSNKIELQNALTVCNGGDIEDAGSPTFVTEPPTTSTTSPSTSLSTTDCTLDQEYSTEDLYDEAAATSACSPYSSSSSLLVTFDTPCSATDCIDVMVQLAADLPDCLYDGSNQKTELTDNLGVCLDDAEAAVDSATPTATSSDDTTSSSPTPASTASDESCSPSEVNDMWELYIYAATSDECVSDSTVNGYSVFIFTSCDSECVDTIKYLAETLPNCYYNYDYINKKQEVLEGLIDCEESFTNNLNVWIESESSRPLASSTSSTNSESPTNSPAPTSSNTPGFDTQVSENSTETTQDPTVGSWGNDAAPPMTSACIYQAWSFLSLLIAFIPAF